jgi:hypothetical protein
MCLKGFKLKLILVLSAIILLSELTAALAQELEPRSYSNIPVGLNFVLAGYSYSAGGVLFDPTVPLENANIKINGSVFAYARSIKVGNMSGKIDMILPYAWLSGTADFKGQPASREIYGFADARIRMSVNFVGSPALPLSGFKDYKQNLIVGASFQIYMPTGQYDPNRVVNIGTNRFTFKPQLGISKTYRHYIFELAGGAAIYTINHDYYLDKTQSQKPIYSLQGHIDYSFRGGMWVALDGTYYWGGRTTIDNIQGNNLQQNSRLGITYSLPLGIHYSLKLNFSSGVSTRTGSDFDMITLLWQYRWGGGLRKK